LVHLVIVVIILKFAFLAAHFNMIPQIDGGYSPNFDGYSPAPATSAADLDEKTSHQLRVVMQYLTAHDYLEALCALEAESGVKYEDGCLPDASVLESSLDMFAQYRKQTKKGDGPAMSGTEEELVHIERGICCTDQREECPGGSPLSANITAVCWAAARPTELVAIVATADKKLRVVGVNGDLLCQLEGLASPVLGLSAAPATTAQIEAAASGSGGTPQEILATSMAGEALVLQLKSAGHGSEQGWSIEVVQTFKDHSKHTTSGRFAPLSDDSVATCHFVTVSRDHKAYLYGRQPSAAAPDFSVIGSVQLMGEVTSSCWVTPTTFVLAARDDHQLRYYDVAGPDSTKGPHERQRINLNALGDNVVSFTALALAVSPDRSLIAVCTDKSRTIVLPTFSGTQLRNLYGAVVDQYDVPSCCFSLDRSFLYVTSSLPQTSVMPKDSTGEPMCGEVVVFEVRTGEVVLKLPCHAKPVRCMDRHPFSETLVTGSFDKKIKFWK